MAVAFESSAKPYAAWRDTVFLRSWIAVFISTSGTFLLLLTLSTLIYEKTQSALLSSSIFASQWILAIVSPPLIAWLSQRFRVITLLAAADFIAAFVAIIIAIIFEWWFAVCLVFLALHGFLEAINKSLRIIPLKVLVPKSHLKSAVSYFATSQYIAAGVGAVGGVALVGNLSILQIALIDVFSFAISGCIYLSFRNSDLGATNSGAGLVTILRNCWSTVSGNIALSRALLYIITLTALFQGFHNIARAEFSFAYLKWSVEGTMYVQIVSSIGIILGAVLMGRVIKFITVSTFELPLMILGYALINE